jgi:ubiquitin-protein ligase
MIMTARLRRLYADWQQVRDEFSGHPNVKVTPMSGNPPEVYRIEYHLKGLELDPQTNAPRIRMEHVAEITLHQGYPREKPKCVMLTPCFHPNVGSYICIDDYWAAGETVADIIIQIGQMIQYQNYNPKSPLNAVAARWAQQNERLFPIGKADLYQPEIDVDLLGEGAGAATPSPKPADDVQIEFV